MKRKTNLRIAIGILIAVFCFAPSVFAQSSSTNYKVEESQFGIGGENELTSTSYQAKAFAGSLGVGAMSSASYDAQAGFYTPSEPFLEVTFTGSGVDFGTLSDLSTSSGAAQGGSCSCSFTVRSYLSSSYIVVTMSQPPANEGGGDALDPKTVLGIPSTDQNTEEFGMNLVDNTSPNIGANPANVPDNSFADGAASTGYNTVDQFKYNPGDTIAYSAATAGTQAVGQTNYTISYIAKRKPLTEAGVYTLNHNIVVTPTY